MIAIRRWKEDAATLSLSIQTHFALLDTLGLSGEMPSWTKLQHLIHSEGCGRRSTTTLAVTSGSKHKKRKSDDDIDGVTVAVTDEEEYLRAHGLALRKRPSTSPTQDIPPTHSAMKAETSAGLHRTASSSIAMLSQISSS